MRKRSCTRCFHVMEPAEQFCPKCGLPVANSFSSRELHASGVDVQARTHYRFMAIAAAVLTVAVAAVLVAVSQHRF